MTSAGPAGDFEPVWNPDVADDLFGKIVLVGLTRWELGCLTQEQFYGRVVRLEEHRGIWLALGGTREGDEFILPPSTKDLKAAPPGTYRLRSTGEEVINPDYLTTWTVERDSSYPLT